MEGNSTSPTFLSRYKQKIRGESNRNFSLLDNQARYEKPVDGLVNYLKNSLNGQRPFFVAIILQIHLILFFSRTPFGTQSYSV